MPTLLLLNLIACSPSLAECELEEPAAVDAGRLHTELMIDQCYTDDQVAEAIAVATDPNGLSYDPTGSPWRETRSGRTCFEVAVWDSWDAAASEC